MCQMVVCSKYFHMRQILIIKMYVSKNKDMKNIEILSVRKNRYAKKYFVEK